MNPLARTQYDEAPRCRSKELVTSHFTFHGAVEQRSQTSRLVIQTSVSREEAISIPECAGLSPNDGAAPYDARVLAYASRRHRGAWTSTTQGRSIR